MNIWNNIKFIFILLLIIILNNNTVLADNFKNLEGYFETIKTKGISPGGGVKLKDGNILFIDFSKFNDYTMKSVTNNDIYILNPQTYKIIKLTCTTDPYKGILLNNGKILYINPYHYSPEYVYRAEINAAIKEKLISDYVDIYGKIGPMQQIEREAWAKYGKLSQEAREKFFIPFLKKDPELLKSYTEYKKRYEKSIYGQLLDTKTGKFEYTGKVNIRRRYPKAKLLSNGNVILWDGSPASDIVGNMQENRNTIEIYNSEDGTFSIVKDSYKSNFTTVDVIQLDDGRLFHHGTLYDINNNSVSYSKHRNYFSGQFHYVKLKDGNIFINRIIDAVTKPESIIGIYDTKNDELKITGKLLKPRRGNYSVILYNDEIVLICGGQNPLKCDFTGACANENSIEIINVKTGEQKILKQQLKKTLYSPIKLDNGKMMFFSKDGIELFTLK